MTNENISQHANKVKFLPRMEKGLLLSEDRRSLPTNCLITCSNKPQQVANNDKVFSGNNHTLMFIDATL